MTTVLRGRRILCTRPAGADAELVALLRAAGALADALPVLATSPIDGGVHALDRALEERPDWAVAFTSATAVAVAEPLLHRLIGRVVAAVGPASARALASHGVTATVVPTLSTARALGAALAAAGVTGVIGAVALEPLPDLADTLLAAQIDSTSTLRRETPSPTLISSVSPRRVPFGRCGRMRSPPTSSPLVQRPHGLHSTRDFRWQQWRRRRVQPGWSRPVSGHALEEGR